MNIRVFKVDLSETNQHLARISEVLAAIARNSGVVVDPLPPELFDKRNLGVSYYDPHKDIVDQAVKSRLGL